MLKRAERLTEREEFGFNTVEVESTERNKNKPFSSNVEASGSAEERKLMQLANKEDFPEFLSPLLLCELFKVKMKRKVLTI